MPSRTHYPALRPVQPSTISRRMQCLSRFLLRSACFVAARSSCLWPCCPAVWALRCLVLLHWPAGPCVCIPVEPGCTVCTPCSAHAVAAPGAARPGRGRPPLAGGVDRRGADAGDHARRIRAFRHTAKAVANLPACRRAQCVLLHMCVTVRNDFWQRLCLRSFFAEVVGQCARPWHACAMDFRVCVQTHSPMPRCRLSVSSDLAGAWLSHGRALHPSRAGAVDVRLHQRHRGTAAELASAAAARRRAASQAAGARQE